MDGYKKTTVDYDEAGTVSGILEVMGDGYGFLRPDNYLKSEDDVYVSPSQIRRFRMKTGDVITGRCRKKQGTERFNALLFVEAINDEKPEDNIHRVRFERLTPIFPHERIILSGNGESICNRMIDLFAPIGFGQRGLIVAPPKAGKTTILKDMASAIAKDYPSAYLIILLIDERPEEVTDIKEAITGENVEVIYSTFDEAPERHCRVAEMVLERGKRLVESGKDVIVLLDSLTRLARAYNLELPPSGRTLSGGLDPVSLYPSKKFFGAARCMREGGSMTIMATALVETGSKMDDMIFEEFKGTGNMELVLDRGLAQRRIFPAVSLLKSGTRRDEMLLDEKEREFAYAVKRRIGERNVEMTDTIIGLFEQSDDNADLIRHTKW
ncbi:MAG: transcription termination factor Rho [Eubacteriales bacterium]|nr:transcription termination factor Rho [Eubacteriales bacterium]